MLCILLCTVLVSLRPPNSLCAAAEVHGVFSVVQGCVMPKLRVMVRERALVAILHFSRATANSRTSLCVLAGAEVVRRRHFQQRRPGFLFGRAWGDADCRDRR